MKASKSSFVTNDKNLNDPTNEDIQNKINQDKEEQFKNYNYAIDLNTGNIKSNNMLAFYLDSLHNIVSNNPKNSITQDMYDAYISNMQEYLDIVTKYKDKKYKSIGALNKDIIKFNKYFDNYYFNGFNMRVKDLLNEVVKNDYIISRATATAMIQRESIKNVGLDTFVTLDLDDLYQKYDVTDARKNIINFYVGLSDMKQLQQEFIKNIDTNDFYNDLVIQKFIFEITIKQTTDNIQQEIANYLEQYKKIHTLYNEIDKGIKDSIENFKNSAIKLQEYDKLPQAKQPNRKEISLYAPKIFNNVYTLDKYTSIDKNNNGRYDVKLNISYLAENNDVIDDLNDVIFIDDISSKQLQLIPLDLALFMGFTSINALNGGNIPITLSDAIKQIAEDKTARVRPNKNGKTPKAYQFYTERLLMFDRFKVKAVISDKEQQNKKVMEFIDPIGIMENKRVYLNNRSDYGYIIGSSAILTILNYLSKISDTPFMTTFINDNQYINDGQKDTLAILNIKYYVLFKILQMNNTDKRGLRVNPKINLEDLYKQTALLKGTSDISRVEKKRVREQLTTYLDHLKTIDNPLLQWYGYEPYKQYLTHKDTENKQTNKAINEIYIKVNDIKN